MESRPVDAEAIARAVEVLRRGGLVAMPTETVYGLAADASNKDALHAIFAAKGRPADHPVIVHIPDAAAMKNWAASIPSTADALAAAFWPGPLTLVVKRGATVSDLITGGQDTIGLRCPAHPWARALLRAFGGAVAAPSANRFGRISPTSARHVIEDLGLKPDGAVDLVLDGGACPVGIESTIVDLSGPTPRLLRPGAVTRRAARSRARCAGRRQRCWRTARFRRTWDARAAYAAGTGRGGRGRGACGRSSTADGGRAGAGLGRAARAEPRAARSGV